jgi:hypothetical protein
MPEIGPGNIIRARTFTHDRVVQVDGPKTQRFPKSPIFDGVVIEGAESGQRVWGYVTEIEEVIV